MRSTRRRDGFLLGRWLLDLYPEELRGRYADEMLETLEARLRAVRAERGQLAALRFWGRNVFDLARGAVVERRDEGGPAALPGRVGRSSLVRDAGRDLRFGARRLAKNPGFTVVALLLLALGIGANSTIFSVLNTVVLRPLPYEDPERLVQIWESNPSQGWDLFSWSHPNYLDHRDQNRTFSHFAAFTGVSYNLTGRGEPARVSAGRVTHDFFPMLGIDPLVGRPFAAEDDAPGETGTVVLLSYGFWQAQLGGAREVVGQTLQLSGVPYVIVGVMPPGPLWLDRWDLFTPLNPEPERNRADHRLGVIARLLPDVTLEQGEADLDAIAARLAEAYPDSNAGFDVRLSGLHESIVGEGPRRALWVLMAAVGFVLLIAATNLANLLLVRSAARRSELALSVALGSSRGRLLRQMTTESVLLAVVGGAAGLGLAQLSVVAFRTLDPGRIPRFEELSVDTTSVLFTLLLSLVVGVFAGLLPAWQATRGNLIAQLQGGGRGATGRAGAERARGVLLIAEVAVSTVLLVGAGLLIRSFWQVHRVDPGLETEGVLAASLSVPPARFFEGAMPNGPEDAARAEAAHQRRSAFYRRLREEIVSRPGIEQAGLISGLPFGGGATSMSLRIEGQGYERGAAPQAYWRIASSGYFETLGIPLLRGRRFEPGDDWNGRPVVIVSERMAERLWPGEEAVGKRFYPWEREESPVEIVGVVGDVRERDLEQDVANIVYLPQDQALYWPDMYLLARSSGDPEAALGSVRAALAELAPDLPLADAEPLADVLDRTLAPRRFNTLLLAAFAATAMVLAAIGIYGVMAHVVGQQRSEIGIRMAMGASPARVRRMVLGQSLRRVAVGAVFGVGGAMLLTRSLASLLYGVSPVDLWSLVGAVGFVGAVALLATSLPAFRASRVAAAESLRSE